MTENVSWITSCPASDGNFKSRLQSATTEEIEEAIHIMVGRGQKGDASRLNAVSREMRKRKKNAPKENK